MPWWSILYVSLFLVVVLAGTYLEPRQGGDKPIVLVLDGVSATICAYFFVSYWVSSWRQPLGAVAPVLFILAAGWQMFETPRGIRKAFADPEFSAKEKTWLLAGVVAFNVPAYVVAGIAVFR